MQDKRPALNALGWGPWFTQRATCPVTNRVARVVAVDRDQPLLVDPAGAFRAKLAGRYLHRHGLPHEQPCVGDWVCVEMLAGDNLGVIRVLIDRRTFLRRKSAGNATECQMIAANLSW